MSENVARRGRRPKTHETKPLEHIIPVQLESENGEVSSTSPEVSDESPRMNLNGSTTSETKDKQTENDNEEECTESADFAIPTRTMPPYNAPEKIVIVFDSAIDEVNTGFSINGETICPNIMLKRSLRLFMYNKHMIDARHEFALVVINDNSVVWLKDFTTHIETIINAMDDIPASEPEDIIVLDNLFQLIADKVALPQVKNNFNVPPSYVVRVLFTYGRSFTMPEVKVKPDALVASPYFTFDILMTHEMPCATNNCIKIFKYLQMIDRKGFAYFFPVGRSTEQLHLSLGKLLSHPLQRPIQREADYAINTK